MSISDDIADFLERSAIDGTFTPHFRYLLYSFDVLMENLADPAHFFVSHHKVVPGISRYNAAPLNAQITEDVQDERVYSAIDCTLSNANRPSCVEFRVPSCVDYIHGGIKSPVARTLLLAVPICSGKSAVIIAEIPSSRISSTKKPSLTQYLLYVFDRFFRHIYYTNKILDGDSVFLHEQDKKIKSFGNSFNAAKDYYIPTSADLLVMEFRKWFETEGEHGAAYGGNRVHQQEANLTKQELLNRFSQHTQHCSFCTDVLEKMKRVVSVLKVLSSLALLTVSSLVFKKFTQGSLTIISVLKEFKILGLLLICVLSTTVAFLLEKKIIPQFYFIDHVHADND